MARLLLLTIVVLIGIANCKQLGDQFNKLVFSDEFDKFDLSVWEHEITMGGGGNWEFEYYTNNRSNSYVKDGVLYMKPTLTQDMLGKENVLYGFTYNLWGSQPADTCTGNAFYGCVRTSGAGGNVLNPIQSARVRTAKSFTFKYGKVEIKAKLPRGNWIWPALWMLPRWNSYGSWPASGEIDIMESRGNDPTYPAGGCNQFGSTLHWGPHWPLDPYVLTHEVYTVPTSDLASDFHVYGLLWTNDSLITYIDNETNVVLNLNINQSFWQFGGWDKSNYDNPWEGRPNNAPFDQEFFLVFNVAVGGTAGYFPDGVGGKPWANSSPHAVNEFYAAIEEWYPTWKGENAAMQIDWVHVYQ